VEPGLDEVHTGDVPLLSGLALLQADVPTSLQFGYELMDGGIAVVEDVLLHALVYRIQVVEFLYLILMVVPEFLQYLLLLDLILLSLS
jgi:hypothetical protein